MHKRWPRQERPVLDGVDLTLTAGTSAWIGGANGAGKTTLLRLLAGMLEPEAGELRVEGLSPLGARRRDYQRRISYLSAGGGGLYARLTTRQHLELWSRLTFMPAPALRERGPSVVDAFSLAGLEDRRADRMSMGQRQRLRLALAFLPPASLVLLDEPVNSLDAEGVKALRTAVDAHTAGGGTVMWCSPSGEEPGPGSSRRFVLADGSLGTA